LELVAISGGFGARLSAHDKLQHSGQTKTRLIRLLCEYDVIVGFAVLFFNVKQNGRMAPCWARNNPAGPH
jgi:hypothetical protein